MAGQGGPCRLIVALLCAAGSPAASFAGDGGPRIPPSWHADAWLSDVAFLDRDRGWAVGDRGTIWHTADGGRTWRRQESGTDSRLMAVSFLDAKNGWIVGGRTLPLTLETRGVVLRTRDGGQKWDHDPGLPLPGLSDAEFFSGAVGWAAGTSTSLFPSGIFASTNGGRNWDPLVGTAGQAWRTGDFIDADTGALAGTAGRLAAVEGRELIESAAPSTGLRSVRRLLLSPDATGWLVGDGALVLATSDCGRTWSRPPGKVPPELDDFDCLALALQGKHAWIAGSPGSLVLHTGDGGKSWDIFRTGQSLPLSGLSFVDELHGWAAGALGTILKTEDGGRTWQMVHAGGTRAAITGFFGGPEDVPLELFARLSGNDGYLGVVQVIGRRDVEMELPDKVPLADRTHEALVATGACGAESAWRFPLRQRGLALSSDQVLAGWDRANEGPALERLDEYIFRQIRTWRPDVVVTHSLANQQTDALGGLVGQAVLRSVEGAADPARFPGHATDLGLAPWKVKKVYSALPPGEIGSANVTAAQVAPRLGRSLAGQAAVPRMLIGPRSGIQPESIGFRLLADALPQDSGRGDFFSGLSLAPDSEARRQLDEPLPETLDSLRRSAHSYRNVQAILGRAQHGPGGGIAWLAQLNDLLADIDKAEAGQLLFQLGQGYHARGHSPEAAETFGLLAERYPDHPLAGAALVWLVQFWSSGEAAWKLERNNHPARQDASTAAVTTGPASDDGPRQAGLVVGIDAAGIADGEAPRPSQRAGRALALGKLMERSWPVLAAEPMVRFPLAVAARNQGQARHAERIVLAMRRGPAIDAWRACATGERWLTEKKGAPPKTVARCPHGSQPPRLDGQIDDAIWQSGAACELRSTLGDDAGWPAVALIAYDDEFLYIAAHCRKAPGGLYPPAAGPRRRDEDLSARDRLELYFDLDRDYASAYRLTLDHRGWAREDSWGDDTWDPKWHVAAAEDDETWTVEAAIPLKELTGQAPRPGDAWAMGIQRIVPGAGFQSWTTPAAIEVRPEGFGYLLFEPETEENVNPAEGP
jgi:photosystem II stability/assembly factor-like uncharacterized protein